MNMPAWFAEVRAALVGQPGLHRGPGAGRSTRTCLRSLALASLVFATMQPAHGRDSATIAKAARSAVPGVQWQERSTLKADLTCRSRPTFAIMGTRGPLVVVAVFADGPTRRPLMLEIASDLLAAQTSMSIESQDFDSGTGDPGDVGPLPGFRRSKTCKGLRLDDERIDSVHIYWNRTEGRFQTWQR